jgi:hypothetical protein
MLHFAPSECFRCIQGILSDLSVDSESLQIEFSWIFEPYVRKWLVRTDKKTLEWVNSAVSVDKVRRLIKCSRI